MLAYYALYLGLIISCTGLVGSQPWLIAAGMLINLIGAWFCRPRSNSQPLLNARASPLPGRASSSMQREDRPEEMIDYLQLDMQRMQDAVNSQEPAMGPVLTRYHHVVPIVMRSTDSGRAPNRWANVSSARTAP